MLIGSKKKKSDIKLKRLTAELYPSGSSANPAEAIAIRFFLNDFTHEILSVFSEKKISCGEKVLIKIPEADNLEILAYVEWAQVLMEHGHVISSSPQHFRLGLRFQAESKSAVLKLQEFLNFIRSGFQPQKNASAPVAAPAEAPAVEAAPVAEDKEKKAA